jgi:hypothetical protein
MDGDMMNVKTTIASVVALASVALCAAGGAYAASVTQPGETAGLNLATPLPVGVYLESTQSDGGWRGVDDSKTDWTVAIPAIAWSTPWTFLGARVEGYAAAPMLSWGIPALPGQVAGGLVGRNFIDMDVPYANVGLAWDLGGGFAFSTWGGSYLPVNNELRFIGFDTYVPNWRNDVAWVGDGWTVAINSVLGFPENDQSELHLGKVLPDYVNVDGAVWKTIDKWEVGIVAFGSADISGTGNPLYKKQSQIAVGGLVGYEFAGITTQVYLTHDVYTDNYFNADGVTKSYETRVWGRFTIPLWTAPKEEVSLK